MNIKQHIEAGHYPKDEKGRSLVPRKNGETVVIYATDAPEGQPLVGHDGDDVERWDEYGVYARNSAGGSTAPRLDLLPPPPRKVEVKAWAVVALDMRGRVRFIDYDRHSVDKMATVGDIVVELTGSYEEPWS